MRTRAPSALTFSVSVLSLGLPSSSGQISTVTALAVRFSNRPVDTGIVFPDFLRANVLLFHTARRYVNRQFVSSFGWPSFCAYVARSSCPSSSLNQRGAYRTFGLKNWLPGAGLKRAPCVGISGVG